MLTKTSPETRWTNTKRTYSEEKVQLLNKFVENGRWTRDPKAVGLEFGLVRSLMENRMFLGRWLDLVYTLADQEQTQKIRQVPEKLEKLYTKGKHALKMNLA